MRHDAAARVAVGLRARPAGLQHSHEARSHAHTVPGLALDELPPAAPSPPARTAFAPTHSTRPTLQPCILADSVSPRPCR